MLEMSGRVDVRPSRTVMRWLGWLGWLGWLDWGPVRSSIFVEQDRGGPFLKIYPCFPRRSQQEAGDRSTVARTGVDPWIIGSLGPWASVVSMGLRGQSNGSRHPCRATRCLRGRWCESCVRDGGRGRPRSNAVQHGPRRREEGGQLTRTAGWGGLAGWRRAGQKPQGKNGFSMCFVQ